MLTQPGINRFGPDNATLTVRTGKAGAAAKAGHNLLIEVTAWEGSLELGEDPKLALTADARSLRVREGTGGIQALGDDDKAGIEQTIDEEVLKGSAIEFRSSSVEAGADCVRVEGQLELVGTQRPIVFELTVGEDGRLTGTAAFKQTDWGIKPYSALFGTLKVADEIVVAIEAKV
jgi:hypothetical protein